MTDSDAPVPYDAQRVWTVTAIPRDTAGEGGRVLGRFDTENAAIACAERGRKDPINESCDIGIDNPVWYDDDGDAVS